MNNLKDIMIDAVKNSVWKPASTADEPRTTLDRWRVFRVIFPSGESSIHFNGYTGFEGRVSSPVQSYDRTNSCGVTRTGRVYRLRGTPGIHRDACWVWDRWCEINKVVSIEDISNTYYVEDSSKETV